jgi:outer membrane protein TolC
MNLSMRYKKRKLTSFIGIQVGHAFLLVSFLLSTSCCSYAQQFNKTDTIQPLTLDQCIDYAFRHQPGLFQSYINTSITKTTNAINLSGWLPQVNMTTTMTHYNSLPTNYYPNTTTGAIIKVQSGVGYTTLPILSANQVIFNPSLLYAAKSSGLYMKQAEQITDSTKIDLVVTVSKSFYSLLLTLQQITVYEEDTVLLAKSLSDAYHQYVAGIVDMTDYQEAAISLNNAKALLKQAMENVFPQYAALKQAMGYPPLNQFNVSFDTTRMKQDLIADTTQELVLEKRIEYKMLQTNKSLQHQLTNYYRSAFLPSLSFFFNYNYEFENNSFSKLYTTGYPYSYLGLSLNIPIFTGFARVENIRRSRMQEQLLNWNQVSLNSEVYTEYSTALANYKGSLYNLSVQRENETLAKNVYDIVTLQYQQGIVPYLNVITAQSNLINSEIGYLTALFQVLSYKVDLKRATGTISYNP